MKILCIHLLLLVVISLVTLTSCTKKNNEASFFEFKVGLMVDAAGLDDKSFNQGTLEGIKKGEAEMAIYYETAVGHNETQFDSILKSFVEKGINLIVSPGYIVSGAMINAANKYPDAHFLLLDIAPDLVPPNMMCCVFDVDQASFLCGFLSAYWANLKDSQKPVAGYVCGPPVPVIHQISVSYTNGVDYFNQTYKKKVICLGAYAENFTDSIRGAYLADSVITIGADVVFAFGGRTGNGALAKTKQKGKWGIGMDSDQYLSYPAVKGILLTSCLKNLSQMTFQALEKLNEGTLEGRTIVHGNLSNQGVSIAPYHDFDAQLPDSVKSKIEAIKQGIINGSIETGWP